MKTMMTCLLVLVLAAIPCAVDATFYTWGGSSSGCCSSLSSTVRSLQSGVQALGVKSSTLSGSFASLLSLVSSLKALLVGQQTALNALSSCDCDLINQRLDDLTDRLETLEAIVAAPVMDPTTTPSVGTPTTPVVTTTTPVVTTTTPVVTTTTPEVTTTTPVVTTTTPEVPTTTPEATTTTPEVTTPVVTTTTPEVTTTTPEVTTTTPVVTTTTPVVTTTQPITTAAPKTGDIRLVNGTNMKEGRVEVYFNGQWGTVCQDRWGKLDATVACRQLGLPSNNPIPYRGTRSPISPFGPGAGPIWLDDLMCAGTEQKLLYCPANAGGINNCDHNEDVGVRCR
ncbi:soluble scavenger receptor cysteine-rich domain-containing protein SSC5D-like [Littorina saxatilis]|uniref:SRCR domain-containing protein n=1 Tax=Littorina saxatilis TaxID=31220 RepID=A0AAN9BSQ2_9CAEN